MSPASEFTALDFDGRALRIEHAWVGPAATGPQTPVIIFLHEGLGSVAMWRDFPARLCAALGARGLLYSRPGYGRSTPRAPAERWAADFMHRQAFDLLPALRAALGLAGQRVWLFGHSDGGSIALLHAAGFPDSVAGVVALAPHLFVEDLSLTSIEAARRAYAETDLRARLAPYHDDPDSAFFGWNRIWLDPAFRRWNIEAELGTIACPVLAIQGRDDEYGTLLQVHRLAALVPSTEVIELPACGHSPHRDQAEPVIEAVTAFVTPHCA